MRFDKFIGALLALNILGCNIAAQAALEPPANLGQPPSANIAPPSANTPPPPPAPLVEKYLLNGTLKDGEQALLLELQRQPKNDQVRFGLGTLQFLRAIEHLAQDLYKFGPQLHSAGPKLPFLRMHLPENAHPQTVTYEGIRAVFDTCAKNLAKSEATLAGITDTKVKLPIHFGMIRLDLNGDGRADQVETLWSVYGHLTRNEGITDEAARKFYIVFDRGDVNWLRGYCHLLGSLCDVYLAYDSRETFNCTAHLFYPKVQTPYPFLTKGRHVFKSAREDMDWADLVALIHTIRWPVAEAWRMTSALHHLEAVVAQSKESWKFIMAETDDDHEWIPNPKQTGVMPNMHVTAEMVTTWQSMMDEIGRILAGEVLIPFWRGDEAVGVNLRKVFLEPQTLDLVEWVQGPAAAPYLEHGKMTDKSMWRSLREVFGGQFPGFAIWFN
jgi:hypothetical protein